MTEQIIYKSNSVVVSDKRIITYKRKVVAISQVREVYLYCNQSRSLNTLNSMSLILAVVFVPICLLFFGGTGILGLGLAVAAYFNYRQHHANTVFVGVRTDRDNIPVEYFNYGSKNTDDAIQKQKSLVDAISQATERRVIIHPLTNNDAISSSHIR